VQLRRGVDFIADICTDNFYWNGIKIVKIGQQKKNIAEIKMA